MGQLEALLNGVNHLEPVDLSPWGGPAEVLVRPLSSPEAGRVDAIRLGKLRSQVHLEGAQAQANPIIEDMGAFLEKQREARAYAVACGLSHSGDICTLEQVSQMPAPWIEALATTILRISGVEYQEESFRDLPGAQADGGDMGDGDAPTKPERDTASPKPAGVDSPSA